MNEHERKRQQDIASKAYVKCLTNFYDKCYDLNIDAEICGKVVSYHGVYVLLDMLKRSEGGLKKGVREAKEFINHVAKSIKEETIKMKF